MKINIKDTVYLVSPHLDDAIFSAGSLVSKITKTNKVILINIFTSPGNAKETLSSRTYLKQIGRSDRLKLFKDRVVEDKKAADSICISKVINLDFVDALWREKRKTILGKMLPELDRIYPTYRYHIVKGIISKSDKEIIGNVARKLKEIINPKHSVVFCPMGFGNHVDHIITREACRSIASSDHLIYWADYPYINRKNNHTKFFNKKSFKEIAVKTDIHKKKRLCEIYKTQFLATIGDVGVSKKELFYQKSYEHFPLEIEKKYFFVRNFNAEDGQSKYAFAVYRDSSGNDYFAKRYSGDTHNREYKFLLNEIACCELIKDIGTNNNKKIRTPNIVYKKVSKDRIMVLFKFIKGNTISKISSDKKVKLFELAISYLDSLDINNKTRNQYQIMSRGRCFWFLVFIYSTIRNQFKQSPHKSKINKVVLIVTKRIYWLLIRNKSSLIHRDFNDFNMIFDDSKITIIDFQLGCFSDPLLERAILLLKYSDNSQMIAAITKTDEFTRIIKRRETASTLIAYWGIMTIYDFVLPDGDKKYSVPSLDKIIKYSKIW